MAFVLINCRKQGKKNIQFANVLAAQNSTFKYTLAFGMRDQNKQKKNPFKNN